MRILPDAWLSEVLAQPVFSVHDAGNDPGALSRHAAGVGRAFYFAKVDAVDLAGLGALARAGFQVVEASLTFARATDRAVSPGGEASVEVSPLEARWAPAVLDVAETAFRYSRFHLDPNVTTLGANRVKREWIRSYIEHRRGDQLLVSLAGDQPTGFLALLFAARGERQVGVVDLVAVHPAFQGRGIGRHLVAAAIAACRGRADVIEVGTQSANVPSVRLYEDMGFRLVRSGFVLHLHTRGD